MKLSKEIDALLNKKNGNLNINECFILERVFETRENDIIGRNIDRLTLVMLPVNDGRRNFFSVEIKSRETSGIIQEVSDGMKHILETYTEQLANRFKGGLD